MRFDGTRAAIVGALTAALVTLPGLGSGTLWDNSETTYGEVAREIGLAHDWVVLHFNGSPWFVQPPLYFWIAALFAQLLGATEVALRFPSALATIGMGAALAFVVARFGGPRAGVVAAIVLSTSLMQAVIGRLAIMDALLDLCVIAAILCWVWALDGRGRDGAFVLGAVLLALGTLTKGPVAPVVTLLVVVPWWWWERRSANTPPVAPSRRAVLLALLAYVALVAPWFLAEIVRAGPASAGELLLHYTIGRYTGVIENQPGPWWYYLPVLILGFFPWIAFVPLAAWRAFGAVGAPNGTLARLAVVWVIVPLVFFSCAQTKLPNYVALVLPGLAIMVALELERIFSGADRWSAVAWAATVPVFVGLLGFALNAFVFTNHLDALATLVTRAFRPAAAIIVIGSAATVVAFARGAWVVAAPYVLGATTLAFMWYLALVAEPQLEGLKPIPALARTIDAQRRPGDVVAIRDAPGSAALTFYTQPVVHTLDTDADVTALICPRTNAFIVTHTAQAAALQQLVSAAGRHADVRNTAGTLSLVYVDGSACTR